MPVARNTVYCATKNKGHQKKYLHKISEVTRQKYYAKIVKNHEYLNNGKMVVIIETDMKLYIRLLK